MYHLPPGRLPGGNKDFALQALFSLPAVPQREYIANLRAMAWIFSPLFGNNFMKSVSFGRKHLEALQPTLDVCTGIRISLYAGRARAKEQLFATGEWLD